MVKLIFFDLDGTLAESKQSMTLEMARRIAQLLEVTRVAVISGGGLPQFQKQVVTQMPEGANLSNLYLLPTSGAALHEYHNDEWHKVYEERLSEKEAKIIEDVILEGLKITGILDFSIPSYGNRIEYRGSQVTLSALGQQAPLSLKSEWDPTRAKRHLLIEYLEPRLPEYLVRIGGTTSVDVTKRGIDKAYGVRILCERVGVAEQEALYVGDALEPGGNDEAVFKTNVQTQAVKNPADTELLISNLLKADTIT